MPTARQLLVSIVALAATSGHAVAERRSARGPRVAQGAARTEPARGERVAVHDLVEVAVRRSPGLAMARADHKAAVERAEAAGAIDQWRLLGAVGVARSALDSASATPSSPIDDRSTQGQLGLQRNLPTGGQLTVTAGAASFQREYVAFTRTTSGTTAPTGGTVPLGRSTATVRVEASHPLLRGLGEDVARADQHQARLAARTLDAQARDQAATLVRDLVVGYWELTYDSAVLTVERDGAELARKQVQITAEVVRAGLQPASAVKRAELEVALREEAMLRAEQAISDQSLALRRMAGLELSPDARTLVPTDALELPTTTVNLDDALAAATQHSPSIIAKDLEQRSADVDVDVAHNALLPRLDLDLSGAVIGTGDSLDQAAGHVGDGQAYQVTAGLSLQWDLGGAAGAVNAAARVHRVRLDAERADLDHQLTAAVISTVRQLDSARRRVALSQVAVEVGEDALRSEVVAFQNGRSTNVAVFQREGELADARLRFARAQVDATEASVVLQYLTGDLLERYGVEVLPAATGKER
jgi:outer membrane protein TolC